MGRSSRLGSAASVILAAAVAAPGPAPGQSPGPAVGPRCEGPSPGPVVLKGAVRTEGAALPVPGATVHVIAPGPGTGADSAVDSSSARVRADSAGRFRLCGVRPGRVLRLRAERFSIVGEPRTVRVPLPEDFPARMRLRIRLGRPGTVEGRVIDLDSSEPVGAAMVRLPAMRAWATTDGNGRFRLVRIPGGRYRLQVHHPGYGTRVDSIVVRPGKSVRLRLGLSPAPVPVDPLRVEVEEVRSLWLESVGFYQRRKLGHGTFITRSQLERLDPTHLSELFRRVAAVQVRGPPVRRRLRSIRDWRSAGGEGGRCTMEYFVDGKAQPLPNGIDTFLPADVAAIEIYRGTAQVPVEFNRGTASCGAIVLWLRSDLER